MKFSIIFGFRNRDIARINRCLDSLKQQTFQDFEVLFIDYGSHAHVTAQAKTLVESYPFCRYIYSDTRGHPWNRAHALNIGIKLATTEYVMTSDIDMIFNQHFIERLTEYVMPDRVIYARCHFLSSNFQDWSHIDSYFGKFPLSTENGLGGCMAISTDLLHQIGGFDEYFRYWGIEDRDLHHRITKLMQIEEIWLPTDDPAHAFYHQWHPTDVDRNRRAPRLNRLPPSIYMSMNYYYVQNLDVLIRNAYGWGECVEFSQRPVYQYIDPNTQQLKNSKDKTIFSTRTSQLERIHNLFSQLDKLSSKEALYIKAFDFPQHHSILTHILRISNWFLNKTGTEIDYSYNASIDFIKWLMLQDSQQAPSNRLFIDYYFEDTLNIGILVKA